MMIGLIHMVALLGGCGGNRFHAEPTIHALSSVHGSWVRQSDGTVAMLTDSRDVIAGVKEVCPKGAICRSESAGVVTLIQIQGELKK